MEGEAELRRTDLASDPLEQFRNWFAEAQQSEPSDPNAMTLATCSPAGCPASRIVLLKDWDAAGFVFYTNVESRKGNELAANPRAALLFHRPDIQVRVEGRVERVPAEESDAYWASRPAASRRSAAASATRSGTCIVLFPNFRPSSASPRP